MTEYGKTKLNKTLREYLAKNTEKRAIEAEVKNLGNEVKSMMGENGLSEYTCTGASAKLTVTVRRELDVAKIEALLGHPIPEDCFKLSESFRLNVKAA